MSNTRKKSCENNFYLRHFAMDRYINHLMLGFLPKQLKAKSRSLFVKNLIVDDLDTPQLFFQNVTKNLETFPADTGCKLNIHKTFSFMYVQFTSCVFRSIEKRSKLNLF